jgi:hypothetical protein
MVLDVTKDPVIRAGIMSKANLQKELEFMEKQRQEGKLAPDNEFVFNLEYQEWLNDKNPTSVFKAKYFPYVDVAESISKRIRENIQADELKIETPYKVDENGNIVYVNGKPVLSEAIQANRLKYLSGTKIYNHALGTLTPLEKKQLEIQARAKTAAMTPEEIFNVEYDAVEKQIKTAESDISLIERTIEEYSKKFTKEEIEKIIAGSGLEEYKNKLKTLLERKSTLDKIKGEDAIEEYVNKQGRAYYVNSYIEKYAIGLARTMAYEHRETEYKDNPFIKYALEKERLDIERAKALRSLQENLRGSNIETTVVYSDPVDTSKKDLLTESIENLNKLEGEAKSKKSQLDTSLENYNKSVDEQKRISDINALANKIMAEDSTVPSDLKDLHSQYLAAQKKIAREEARLNSSLQLATELLLKDKKVIGEGEKKMLLDLYNPKTKELKASGPFSKTPEEAKQFYNLLSSGQLYTLVPNAPKNNIYYSPDYKGTKPLKATLTEKTVYGGYLAPPLEEKIEVVVYGPESERFIDYKDPDSLVKKVTEKPFVDYFKNNILPKIYFDKQSLKLVITKSTSGNDKYAEDDYSQISAIIEGLSKNKEGVLKYTKEGTYEKLSNGEIRFVDPENDKKKISIEQYIDKQLKGGSISFDRHSDGTIVATLGLVSIPVPQNHLYRIMSKISKGDPGKLRDFDSILFEPDLLELLRANGTTNARVNEKYGSNHLYAYFRKEEPSLIYNYPSTNLYFGENNSKNGEYKVVAYDIIASGYDPAAGVYRIFSPKIYVMTPQKEALTIYGNDYPNVSSVVYYTNTLFGPKVLETELTKVLKLNQENKK